MHPDELLAGYVDGSLAGSDRSVVDDHLAECARCRGEVALAAETRAALSGLEDVAPPPGLPTAVRRELRRRSGRGWRIVAASAVAAGVIAGGILVAGTLRTEGPVETREQAGEPAPAPEAAGEAAVGDEVKAGAPEALAAETAPVVTTSRTDYEPKALAPFARRLRDDARAALAQGFPPTATDYYRRFNTSAFDPHTRRAVRCALADISPEQAVVPFVIEEATFQGSPAYVAGFLQGPAPDQPYDRILIWVADRESCALRSLASQQL
jgi:anti-sigma factor RsiW